jgi:hypothetical protein
MSPRRKSLNFLAEQLKLFSPGRIMSPGRRSLNCVKEQLKLFFLGKNHVPMEKELMLPWGAI